MWRFTLFLTNWIFERWRTEEKSHWISSKSIWIRNKSGRFLPLFCLPYLTYEGVLHLSNATLLPHTPSYSPVNVVFERWRTPPLTWRCRGGWRTAWWTRSSTFLWASPPAAEGQGPPLPPWTWRSICAQLPAFGSRLGHLPPAQAASSRTRRHLLRWSWRGGSVSATTDRRPNNVPNASLTTCCPVRLQAVRVETASPAETPTQTGFNRWAELHVWLFVCRRC